MSCFPCALAFAGEPYLEFARALRDRGYADMAVMYLQQTATRTDIPASVRQVLDLELSISYEAWGDQTKDEDQAKQRSLESKRLLEQFTKNNPRHPGLAQAQLESGDRAFDRGLRLWMQAEKILEPTLRAKLTNEAQQALQESLRSLRAAFDRFKQLSDAGSVDSALPKTDNSQGPSAEDQQRIELGMAQSRFKAGAAELYLARTFAGDHPTEHKSHLQKAAEDFDWAYRRYPNAELGLRALLWQAKATEESGQDADAKGLYDDVLSAEQDAMGKASDIAALFGQAAYWRVQLIARLEGDEMARNEASQWMRQHPTWRETGPYQGIALECAKALLRRGKNETPKFKDKLTKEAMDLLAEIAVTPSEFQNEAIRLQQAKGVIPDTNSTKGDWVATGDAAMAAEKWVEAIAAYESAVEAAKSNPDRTAIATARNRLNFARYRLATSLYSAGKLADSLEASAIVAKSGATEPHASEAASLSCFTALALFESANDASRAEASSRLERIAEFTRKTWPNQPAAHDADIVLGHWEAKREKWDEAIQRLEQVPATSSRFARAAFYIARIYWKRALDERRKPDGERDDAAAKKSSEQAIAKLQAAVGSSTLTDAEATSNQSWFDGCLLLGEIYLEENQYQPALDLLAPLLARFPLTENQTDPNAFAVDLHTLALRAYTAAGQIETAEQRAIALSQLSADSPAVNGALLRYLQLARTEIEKSQAELDKVKGTFQQVFLQETAAKMEQRKKGMTSVVASLAKRKQLSLPSLAYLADTCRILELREAAVQICQRILQDVGTSSGDAAAAQYAMKARFQLAAVLGDEGKYAEAVKFLNELAADHPNSLELLMKKGEVLQAWAKQDPKHYDECVAHWTQTRLLLSRVKPRPKEYYDVVYNTALCLSEQSQRLRDTLKLQQAQQLLKSTMVLSAGLDGPETVKKYETLLTQLQNIQDAQGKPTAQEKSPASAKPVTKGKATATGKTGTKAKTKSSKP